MRKAICGCFLISYHMHKCWSIVTPVTGVQEIKYPYREPKIQVKKYFITPAYSKLMLLRKKEKMKARNEPGEK